MSDESEKDGYSVDVNLASIGLEVLTMCLVLYRETLLSLHTDETWQAFIIDMILICKTRFVYLLYLRFVNCLFTHETVYM